MSNDVKHFVEIIGTSPTHECTPNPETVIRSLEKLLYGKTVPPDSYYKVKHEKSGLYSFWAKGYAPRFDAIWNFAVYSDAHIEAEFWSLDNSFMGSMVYTPAGLEVTDDCQCTSCRADLGTSAAAGLAREQDKIMDETLGGNQ